MKIAYFSPLAPQKSGISNYSENQILPFLKQYCDIDLIVDNIYTPTNEFLKKTFNIIPFTKFQNKKYDVILYNMGNNLYHDYIYKTALQFPGIVILHDPFISGYIWSTTINKGDNKAYTKHMIYCLGEKGKKIAENAVASNNYPSFEYPLVKKLADSSLAIVVHSEFAKKVISVECVNTLIKKINMPIQSPKDHIFHCREDLEISINTTIIGSFGFVAPHKRIDVIIRSFSKYLEINPNAILLIVGSFLEKNYEITINNLIKNLNLSNKIILKGYVEDTLPYIQASDIIIQTRYPTAGETSIITLEIMARGKSVIVSNIGWFAELPDDSVIKIDVNEKEEENIIDTLIRLSSDIKFTNNLKIYAKQYVIQHHDPQSISQELFEFLKLITSQYEYDYIRYLSHKLSEITIEGESRYLELFSNTVSEILFRNSNK